MTCDRNECRNTATTAARLCVPASGVPLESHEPLKAVVGLAVCDKCFKELDPADFLSASLEKGLRGIFEILAAGKAAPDFDRAWFEKLSLDSPEYKLLLKSRKTTE